jgi:3'-phosphoadenosine 5'-phosphosulfate (PAPS) 3'-phosphatase
MHLNDLERKVLASWRANGGASGRTHEFEALDAWITLILRLGLLASRHVRAARLGDLGGDVVFKADRTPLTAVDLQIERLIVDQLSTAPFPVSFIGEETPPTGPPQRVALAVDPIDGTWSLLNRTETAATSFALMRDGAVFVAAVANPATAEIAYVAEGRSPRLLQLSAFGEGDHAVDLPIPPAGPEGLLVSLHPHRTAEPVAKALARAWQAGELDMVRSAGGEAVDLSGNPIRETGHRGPFVAALNAADRERVAGIALRALAETNGEGR